jgi:enoyl-CoA hydratase/carnithine racemase
MTTTLNVLLRELNNKGVLRLTLRDEKHRNALSEAMLNAIGNALDEAASNPEVRVIVLAAQGPAFCAGHDLKEISAQRNAADGGQTYFTTLFSSCAHVMQAIVNHPKPVIAEIAGVATAAGCQLVASCDLAVAADTSKFATPGVNIGLFCSTPMVALSRNVSNKHAMEMLLTGDMVSATRAEQIGLINRVVEAPQLTEVTMGIAATIASKSTMTVATGKTAFYKQKNMDLNSAYAYTSQIMVDNMLKLDAKEGISAFIEKRPPEWQDR